MKVKELGIAVALVTIFVTITLTVPTLAISTTTVSTVSGLKHRVKFIRANVTIIEITENYIVVTYGEQVLNLTTRGMWLAISSENIVSAIPWSKAMEYVREGQAVVEGVVVKGVNATRSILLALKQGSTVLLRLRYLRHLVKKVVHDEKETTYRLLAKGDRFILVEKSIRGRKVKFLAHVGGRWYRAGYGFVNWTDVVDEFNIGDRLWMCAEGYAILRPNIAGIRVIIFGFSGAIVDLNTGVALVKVP
ncbi:MAG: hypothetical protein DRJ40_06495 [Thermoprotei archaeon]|nr:MAG: hypothetical protein DRJ40_06495 [Thermoprotei archaeon]